GPWRHCGGQGKLIEGADDVVVGGASSGGSGGGGDAGGGGAGGGGGGAGGAGGGAGGAGSSSAGTTSAAAPASGTGPASSSPANDEVSLQLVDAAGEPLAGIACALETPDGHSHEVKTDANGKARVQSIPTGDCSLTFPSLA